jgi:hypothetical protein
MNNKPIECVVLWFNRTSGEGMVQGIGGGPCREIYASNIPGKKTWYPQTACVYYGEGQIIEVDVTEKGRFIVPRTPGIFDEEKWNSLDHDRLAFRCDDKGEAINGLFHPVKG